MKIVKTNTKNCVIIYLYVIKKACYSLQNTCRLLLGRFSYTIPMYLEVSMKEQSSSKGFAVLSSASIICKVLSLVYLPVQTLLVHDSGNGVISAGFKLYLFIYALTNAGLPVVISKFVSEQVAIGDYRSAHKTFKSAMMLMLSFGVISTLFTFFGSGLLDQWCGLKSQSTLMFMVIAPTFLFTSVSSSLRGYFQGRHNMTPTAISQIVEQIFNSVLTVVFEILMFNYAKNLKASDSVRASFTAAGSAAATALAAMCSALFLCYIFFVVFRRQRRHEIQHQEYDGPIVETSYIYKLILKFSIPALISCVAASAIDLIDTRSCVSLLMKGGYLYSEATSLWGIYATKYQRLMTLATMFVAPLVTAMIPSLASALANHNHRYFRYKIRESYKLIFIVVMPVVAGLSFLANPIITVMFLRDNQGALMIILGTWTALLMAAQAIQSGILISLNKPLISPINTIIGMAAKLLCNYLLVPIHAVNIYGALIGNAAAWIIAILLNQYFINIYLHRKQHTWRYMILPGFSAIIMGVACLGIFELLYLLLRIMINKYFANDIAVFITIPIGALIYLTLMLKTGGIKPKDIIKLPMGGKLYQALKKVPVLRKDFANRTV